MSKAKQLTNGNGKQQKLERDPNGDAKEFIRGEHLDVVFNAIKLGRCNHLPTKEAEAKRGDNGATREDEKADDPRGDKGVSDQGIAPSALAAGGSILGLGCYRQTKFLLQAIDEV